MPELCWLSSLVSSLLGRLVADPCPRDWDPPGTGASRDVKGRPAEEPPTPIEIPVPDWLGPLEEAPAEDGTLPGEPVVC